MNQPGHTTALHERLIDFKSGDMDAREAIIEHTCERLRLRTRQMLRAFGRVYKAFDPELARHVAVKVPNRHGETNGQVDSLVDEARRVAKLRHPGIVSVHDVGNDDGHCFIVSELIEGKNLSEVIASDRPNVKEAVLLVAEIAENLEAAHKAGFVHRDIKPANILIDENGKPLITDFGIASTHDAIGGMATKGTLPYMAPEQIANEPQLIDQRSDIYSLGVVLYEMLTGESPYSARTPGTLREQILFRSPKPIPDSVLPSVKKVSLKSLSKHPADRFESAEELAVALRNSLTDRPARNQTIPWRSLAIIGCIATALALAFFAGKASNQLDSDQTNVASTVIGSDNFVFDGMSRIVTPLDRFAPVTIEAWVRPDSYRNELQMIVGSDIAGQFGIGMGLSPPLLSAEVIPPNGEQGLIYADGSLASVPVQAWSHVAVVFADTETRLYLNGRLSGTGMATQPEGGSNFVIGNIGETGHMYFFNGRMKSIRISKGERFQDSFVPDDTFKADGQNFGTPAVVIYDASRQQKVEQITDYSGEGNHGA